MEYISTISITRWAGTNSLIRKKMIWSSILGKYVIGWIFLNVENLTLLNNVRFLLSNIRFSTSFRHLSDKRKIQPFALPTLLIPNP